MKLLGIMVLIAVLGMCMRSSDDESVQESVLADLALDAEANKPEFDAYWFAGQAEISSYRLTQARYGELHEGSSVLVFVTEDFLVDAQVKKESATDAKSTPVLKLNKIDRFVTGIYDYSLMLSAFSPIDHVTYPFALKTTFSAQDWCGQSFMQINRRGSGYQAQVKSYFEAEGDKSSILESVVLEDELWTLARLDPRIMPTGSFEIIPSSQELRLRHGILRPESASATLVLELRADQTEEYIYTLKYDSGRELSIHMQSVFPYRIYGWEEKVKSGGQWLTSKAVLDKTVKSAYWSAHGNSDSPKRQALGLD